MQSNNLVSQSYNYPSLQNLVMEKKSKILGQRLIRKVQVKDGILTDLDKSHKQYLDPIQFVRQEQYQHEKIWYEECKKCEIRMLVKFDNRSSLFIYLENRQHEQDFKEACLLKGGGLSLHRKSKPQQQLAQDLQNVQREQ